MDAAVLAGDTFAVPVVCSTAGHAQIWVTLPHGQVAGTLFSVALRLTSAAWEAVLAWETCIHRAALKRACAEIIYEQTATVRKNNVLCYLAEYSMILRNNAVSKCSAAQRPNG